MPTLKAAAGPCRDSVPNLNRGGVWTGHGRHPCALHTNCGCSEMKAITVFDQIRASDSSLSGDDSEWKRQTLSEVITNPSIVLVVKNMLSPFAKFSLSDASDFLNSDDEQEGDNDHEKSGSPFEVNNLTNFGQNSSSEAEDYHRGDHIDDDDDMRDISCKKRSFSSRSVSRNEGVKNTSLDDHSTAHSGTVQTKKRAGSAKMNCASYCEEK
jgi:hypothetical protein